MRTWRISCHHLQAWVGAYRAPLLQLVIKNVMESLCFFGKGHKSVLKSTKFISNERRYENETVSMHGIMIRCCSVLWRSATTRCGTSNKLVASSRRGERSDRRSAAFTIQTGGMSWFLSARRPSPPSTPSSGRACYCCLASRCGSGCASDAGRLATTTRTRKSCPAALVSGCSDVVVYWSWL